MRAIIEWGGTQPCCEANKTSKLGRRQSYSSWSENDGSCSNMLQTTRPGWLLGKVEGEARRPHSTVLSVPCSRTPSQLSPQAAYGVWWLTPLPVIQVNREVHVETPPTS